MAGGKYNNRLSYQHPNGRRDEIGVHEIRFATEKRGMGASWNSIAVMLNCAVHDLRMAADPAYVGAPSAAVIPIAALAPSHRQPIKAGSLDAHILVTLRRHTMSTTQLANHLQAERKYVVQRVTRLHSFGLIAHGTDLSPRKFFLTEAGKLEVRCVIEIAEIAQ